MKPIWSHPQLGEFAFEKLEDCWTGSAHVPAFTAFQYDGPAEPKRDLIFDGASDKTDTPSDAAVAVALRVLANQADLPRTVAEALWDDFNGRGPDSGMWWHGDMEQVAEMTLEPDQPPTKSDDFFKLMRLACIYVHKEADGYRKPVAELSFAAAFEEEHGVGVLTDGDAILGTGYSLDAAAFAKPRRKRSGA